jgi:hypothetical protein
MLCRETPVSAPDRSGGNRAMKAKIHRADLRKTLDILAE